MHPKKQKEHWNRNYNSDCWILQEPFQKVNFGNVVIITSDANGWRKNRRGFKKTLKASPPTGALLLYVQSLESMGRRNSFLAKFSK